MTEQQNVSVSELSITADGFLTVHEGDEIPEGWQGEIEKKAESKPHENDDEGDKP